MGSVETRNTIGNSQFPLEGQYLYCILCNEYCKLYTVHYVYYTLYTVYRREGQNPSSNDCNGLQLTSGRSPGQVEYMSSCVLGSHRDLRVNLPQWQLGHDWLSRVDLKVTFVVVVSTLSLATHGFCI